MHYYLIEDLNEGLSLPKDCTVVALTYVAISKLEKFGYNYITFEDFYRSGEIRGDTDVFLKQQLLWFRDFDEFIKDVFPEAKRLNVNLASIYYYWIKHCVDNVILSVRIIRRFIESAEPKKIVFLTREPGPDLIDHVLSFKNAESTYSRLIEPICKAEGIEFERLILEDGLGEGYDTKLKPIYNREKSLRELIKKVIPRRIVNFLKTVRDIFYRYRWLFKSGSLSGKGAGNIFVLNSMAFVHDFLETEKRHHYKYFFYENGSIRKYSLFGFWKIRDIDETLGASIGNSSDWEKVLHCLCNGQIMYWVNAQCGLDVSSVLVSRFELFLREICPEILSMVPVFTNFYDKYDIDFVTIGFLWTPGEHAAVTAARHSVKTKSAYFIHGVDALEVKSRIFTLTRFFDVYFVSSKEEVEDERKLLKEFNLRLPEVFESPHFQKRCRRALKFKYLRKGFRSNNGKRIVLFVPVMCTPWPNRPVEKGQPFPMEYVKWHRSLADFISTRKDYQFIWKAHLVHNQKFDLMKEILKEKKYDNISFYSNKLMSWLPVADRVLCDTPSTAFFEAIYSKLPIMGLFRPDDQALRENAYDSFGNSLRPYSSTEEGIKIVEEFLDGDPGDYIVSFQEKDSFVSDARNSFL